MTRVRWVMAIGAGILIGLVVATSMTMLYRDWRYLHTSRLGYERNQILEAAKRALTQAK